VRATKRPLNGLDSGDGIMALDFPGQSHATIVATASRGNDRTGVICTGKRSTPGLLPSSVRVLHPRARARFSSGAVHLREYEYNLRGPRQRGKGSDRKNSAHAHGRREATAVSHPGGERLLVLFLREVCAVREELLLAERLRGKG
jgi:hypothetical protein